MTVRIGDAERGSQWRTARDYTTQDRYEDTENLTSPGFLKRRFVRRFSTRALVKRMKL